MDYIELSQEQGVKYALVVICAFSKWTEIYPVKHTDAKTTASAATKIRKGAHVS